MATISERLQYILQFDTRQAVSSMDEFGKRADKNLETTEQKTQRLGTSMTKYGAAAVAAAGVAGVGLFKLAQSASAVEESTNAVNVTFEDQSDMAQLLMQRAMGM